jgi:hypothetical protein
LILLLLLLRPHLPLLLDLLDRLSLLLLLLRPHLPLLLDL